MITVASTPQILVPFISDPLAAFTFRAQLCSKRKSNKRVRFESDYPDSWLDQSHKSHGAPIPYPTMHHSEQKYAHFCSEWCIVGYRTGALWVMNLVGWDHIHGFAQDCGSLHCLINGGTAVLHPATRTSRQGIRITPCMDTYSIVLALSQGNPPMSTGLPHKGK